ncbi:E3 ubiquitin-protein ligase TRIM33-like [Branchiostoma lanceolatum]|uniref:E3 ubiquitin-protein ligase TRIM33-like n=1 Tax=Branchiostoma lanceolatum TaxID=7740 RepID=UPI003453E1BC
MDQSSKFTSNCASSPEANRCTGSWRKPYSARFRAICLEPFKDSKILQCLHTFCKGCLEKFVGKQGEVKDKFPCPTCRTETVLPGGGVVGLKNNFFVLSLRDTVQAHKSVASVGDDDKVRCDVCEEEVATCGCAVCEEFMCDECARAHHRAKRTRDHEVIGVAELKEQLITKTSSVKSTSLPMCPKHEDEKLKFYCETCQHPICRDCTVLQHKDHKYGLLADIVSDVRAKINDKLAAARPKIEEYRDVTNVITKTQGELDTRSKKAADDIDAAAEEEITYLIGLVKRKQTELKEKLAAVTAAHSKQLSATADSVESTLGCLSSTVDFSQKVVEHGSDFDVMNVYSDVTARLESLLKGPTPDIPDISYVIFDPRTEREETEIILGNIADSSFRSAKFTTLGTTGRLGPTTLGNHYRGQDHEHLVTLHDGIQHFTVPGTGTYTIEAAGAAAGWGMKNPKSARGRGAIVRGTFNLKQGETLKILVGQEGAGNTKQWGVGGGGGTFVTRGNNLPLIIAAGGGGGISSQSHNPLCDGTVSTTGNKSPGGAGCGGGSNGQGATEWKGDYMGGGGGGLLTDGGSSKRFGGDSCDHGGEGGKAFVNGGVGGRGHCNDADGGFGGGGGSFGNGGGGGGGGGYSGGGRGENCDSNGGGGGGSLNSGTDFSGQGAANDAPGFVVITRQVNIVM